ncbi:MAG: 3-hydroxyacyl-CoA dehydrogenase [Acidimicrobiia bacterium]|nr:3-hydroxyacyl-CoA dehydrogenase [Acidimicrobiia bacterium]
MSIPNSRSIGIVGAGTMGEGIAQVAAGAGHQVLLFDVRSGAASDAIDRIAGRLARSVERGKRTQPEADAVIAQLGTAASLDDFSRVGLVIEAAVENLEAKQGIFRELDSIVPTDALFASNTSSISITAIASAIADPKRLAGFHFFNPAPAMALVEVVAGLATAADTMDTLVDLALAWGKTPIRTISSPGFVGNRVARPFYGEALRMLEEGVADAFTIDSLVRGSGGFPMGPFQLMDLVGIDVNLAVSTSVWEATSHDPRFAPSFVQREMVSSGRLGRKSGRGFHRYDDAATEPLLPIVVPGSMPRAIEVVGDAGALQGLVDRLVQGGVRVDRVFGGKPHLRVGAVRVALTDGATATTLDLSPNTAVIDLAHDYSAISIIGVAVSDGASPDTITTVAGMLAAAGIRCVQVDDSPGLVVGRIVASLVNLAADTVHFGIASPRDVDAAMRLGFGYPIGPLAWGDKIGPGWVADVVGNLHEFYQEPRYRVSPLVRRRVASGDSLVS